MEKEHIVNWFAELYDPEQLATCLGAPFEVWTRAPGAQTFRFGTEKEHIFFDRGADILAVAHLDSVKAYNGFKYDEDKYRLHCATVDDRIGVWTILYVLPQLGINVDVLLTTGEETGQSTAQYFKPPPGKSWNWMVEFDRGTFGVKSPLDWVTYQYIHNKKWIKALGEFMPVARGSTSDIAYLGHLGICGVNCQTGMADYHSGKAYVELMDWEDGLDAFLQFHAKYAGTKFEYDKIKHAAPKPTYTKGWESEACECCGKKWPRSYPTYSWVNGVRREPKYHICDACTLDLLDILTDTFGPDALKYMVNEKKLRDATWAYADSIIEEAEGALNEQQDERWNDVPFADEDDEEYVPYWMQRRNQQKLLG